MRLSLSKSRRAFRRAFVPSCDIYTLFSEGYAIGNAGCGGVRTAA